MEHTCGNCAHLVGKEFMGSGVVMGCDKTGAIVPHNANFPEDKVIFFRVPEDCPRPDSEIRRSTGTDDRADDDFWVIKKISEVPIK